MSMVAFYTWLIFMEISLFASLFTPPGLHRQPEPIASSRDQQAHSSVQGSDHQAPARQSTGRRGPKSPGGARYRTFKPSIKGSADVRVARPSAGMAGASTGSGENATLKAKHCTRANKISSAKRAFRRAQHRALAHGSTMYRGRVCTAASLGCHSQLHAQEAPPIASRTSRPQRFSTHHHRLRVISFNVGGLCAASYDVMANWLQHSGQQYDVILLQETHFGLGKELLEFSLPGWSVISSPDPNHRHAGVAVIVSCKPAPSEALQYRAVKPGRILHVRFPVGQGRQARAVDVVSAYQWAWDAEPAKGRLDARRKFWEEISSLVQSFPKRNVHCVAGDFNCPLGPQGQCAGQGIYPGRQAPPDSQAFGDLIRCAGLCALNTWTRAREAYTFHMPGETCKRTQIDFVLASPNATDLRAKRSAPTDEVCFAPCC